jgi:hypothetical protein
MVIIGIFVFVIDIDIVIVIVIIIIFSQGIGIIIIISSIVIIIIIIIIIVISSSIVIRTTASQKTNVRKRHISTSKTISSLSFNKITIASMYHVPHGTHHGHDLEWARMPFGMQGLRKQCVLHKGLLETCRGGALRQDSQVGKQVH